MTAFWIAAGLLLAGALLFVLPPLLSGRAREIVASHDAANVSIYRDQLAELEADLASGAIPPEQYEQSKREIEKRVLEEVGGGETSSAAQAPGRMPAILVGLAIPALAIGLYVMLGTPAGLDPKQAAAAAGQDASHSITPEQIAAMTETLAERLKQNPNDLEGWAMLARSYGVLQRYPEAAKAYAEAVRLQPNNAQLLADYADTLGMAQGRSLLGEPEKVIEQALRADPNNIKALALSGTVAFARKEYARAAAQWQKILPLLPPESDFARAIGASVAEATTLAGGKPPAAAPQAQTAQAAAAGGANVSGTVSLAPAIAGKVAPTDTVFVFARAAEGPRMPLAIVRKQVKDLPFRFSLDDSMAMAPNAKLSLFPQVVVGARVSKSGNATAQAGDFEGLSAPVQLGAKNLEVTIASEVR